MGQTDPHLVCCFPVLVGEAAQPKRTVTWYPAQRVCGKMFGDGVLGTAQKAWLVSSALPFASSGK